MTYLTVAADDLSSEAAEVLSEGGYIDGAALAEMERAGEHVADPAEYLAGRDGWHLDADGHSHWHPAVAQSDTDATSYLTRFVRGYLECAVWASTDAEGESLDNEYTWEDFAPATIQEAREECAEFVREVWPILWRLERDKLLSAERSGHDFWLTRNGHGAGFWDRGLGADGATLTAACKPYGYATVMVERKRRDEDGTLYIYNG